LLILAWRQRKHGRPARATAIADQARSPRAVWPVVGLLAGAGLMLIGQGLETPLEGTGSYLAWVLAVLGVAMVAVSGWRNRERRASSGPTPGEAVPIVGKALEHLAPRGWKTWSEEHPPQAWSSGTLAHKEFAKNSELTAGLVGSGLLLLVGRMISPVLFDWERAWVVIYTGLGLALFVFTAMGFTGRPLPRLIARPLGAIAGWLGVAPARAVLLTVAPLISLVARLAAGDAVRMRHAGLAVIAWLTGIGLVVLGSGVKLTGRRERFRFSAESLGLGGLFLVALLVRGIGVAQAPWLFTGDEGSAGLTAVQFIDGFRDNLFAVGWFSFPSMFFFIQSLFIRAFGQTVQALRLLSALVGALTVVPTYFFAREVFGRRIAWASAIYLAAFHFHIHFSRIALNNIWDGFFTALFSAVFWRGWLRNQRGAFVAAGFALGLSQYFYVSVRVLVPLLALWLLAALIKNRSEFRARLPGLLTMTLAALVVALPLALFFVQNPEEFQAPLGRVAAHGAWIEAESELTGKSAVEIMWGQFKNAALGFTSVNLRLFYEPGQPMLLSLPATLFLMGLTLVVLRIRQLTSIYVVLW
ncbi:MAG: ArnT family glycosyltransferase, partial [Anaerolineales bacterium]